MYDVEYDDYGYDGGYESYPYRESEFEDYERRLDERIKKRERDERGMISLGAGCYAAIW